LFGRRGAVCSFVDAALSLPTLQTPTVNDARSTPSSGGVNHDFPMLDCRIACRPDRQTERQTECSSSVSVAAFPTGKRTWEGFRPFERFTEFVLFGCLDNADRVFAKAIKQGRFAAFFDLISS
jgi:hypothetical protein